MLSGPWAQGKDHDDQVMTSDDVDSFSSSCRLLASSPGIAIMCIQRLEPYASGSCPDAVLRCFQLYGSTTDAGHVVIHQGCQHGVTAKAGYRKGGKH